MEPTAILLDRSLHHSAMARLSDDHKRGRPDLVHVTLLSMTSTPLYADGDLKLFIHTHGDVVLEVKERTRLPKSYLRFRGLAEKILAGESEGQLVSRRGASIGELLRSIGSDWVCGLSTQGRPMKLQELGGELASKRNPCAVIGGFPHGHFSASTLKELDSLVRIDPRPLDAHVVAARLVYEVEKEARRDGRALREDAPRPL